MSDGWTTVALGDCFSRAQERLGEDGEVPLIYSLLKEGAFRPAEEVFAGRVASRDLATYRVVRPGRWAYSTIHIDEGSIARFTESATGVISPMYTTLDVRDDAPALPQYLELLLRTPQLLREYRVRAAGSINRRRSLPFDRFAAISVELPPLDEQRRIVDLIGSLDATHDASQGLAVASARAGTAVVDEALARGDGWASTTMGAVLEIARGGSPRPIEEYLTSDADGINWVKIGDVASGDKYVTATAEKIRPEGATRSRRVAVGDFILSNSMSFGRPYIMSISGCIHDGWLLLRDAEGAFDQDFLYWLLRSNRVQHEFRARAAGSGVRNLNISVVGSVEIPLPPLDEQTSIARAADAAANLGRLTHAHAEAAQGARRALLRDLLSGTHQIPPTYDRLLEAA